MLNESIKKKTCMNYVLGDYRLKSGIEERIPNLRTSGRSHVGPARHLEVLLSLNPPVFGRKDSSEQRIPTGHFLTTIVKALETFGKGNGARKSGLLAR
jgi:hypothetical protein